jgi:putative PIN family toxin of toxin-antitoxin system
VATLRRIVVDPNVLVSAATTTGGVTAAILDLIDAGVIVPIVSPRLLAELDAVLRRDKFRDWLDLDTAAAFMAELERLAETAVELDEPTGTEDPG